MNVDLLHIDGTSKCDEVTKCVFGHCQKHNLVNCYDLFPSKSFISYANEALGHFSLLDSFFSSKPASVADLGVVEPDCNFSDHLPILTVFQMQLKEDSSTNKPLSGNIDGHFSTIELLRWDHADIISYYEFCRINLMPILSVADNIYDS
jgi:hypothetical protein